MRGVRCLSFLMILSRCIKHLGINIISFLRKEFKFLQTQRVIFTLVFQCHVFAFEQMKRLSSSIPSYISYILIVCQNDFVSLAVT